MYMETFAKHLNVHNFNHPPNLNLLFKCLFRRNHLLHAEAIINEKTPTNREIHKRSTQKTRTIKQERKLNTIFNEVRQFAYVLGARERNILLI